MHTIHERRLGVIPSKRALLEQIEFGVVAEVDILATDVGRSGTRVEDELDESEVDGS
jgi:hypothetical protein